MNILVTSMEGKTFQIDCFPKDKIESIKIKICEKVNLIRYNFKRTKPNQTPKDIIENPVKIYKIDEV